MTNYIKSGEVITLLAPYTVTSGQGALVGSAFGVANEDTTSGIAGEFSTVGVFSLTKTSAQAWTVGALIYWDDSARNCTTTSASNKLIGTAMAIAANPSATGQVRLNGSFNS